MAGQQKAAQGSTDVGHPTILSMGAQEEAPPRQASSVFDLNDDLIEGALKLLQTHQDLIELLFELGLDIVQLLFQLLD